MPREALGIEGFAAARDPVTGSFRIDALFSRSEPQVRVLYDRFVALVKAVGPVRVIPQKSRIAFQVRMRFAAVTPQKTALKGHLVLAEEVVGFHPPGLYVEVGLHVATLLSVFVAYRSRILGLTRGLLTRDHASWRYAGLLVLASVPAAIAGLFFADFFVESFDSGDSIGIQFLVTALILWATRPVEGRATGQEISVKGGGGPTCLTRPIRRRVSGG